MTIKICHFSDWHGKFPYKLAYADLYICTGDMLPNFPKKSRMPKSMGSFGPQYNYWIDPECEKEKQEEWIKNRCLRDKFVNKDAPVVCVRGNHDYTSLSPLFGGEVYEIGIEPKQFEVLGLKIDGFRGILETGANWIDEFEDFHFFEQVNKVKDDTDILVTHLPPFGILDGGFGSHQISSWHNKKSMHKKNVKLHCFGHVHHRKGIHDSTEIIFSNAATKFNKINL